MTENDLELTRRRQEMVSFQLRNRDITDQLVLAAMAELPRERFVSKSLRGEAYTDGPLPIGQGQTISQPYIQALMSQHLHLDGQQKVLEVGTGSGYQTAILAKVSRQVHTIERLYDLSETARVLLESLGFDNIHYHLGDGSEGLPREAPFDAILVTAACPRVPEPLLQQLAQKGRLVAPTGTREVQDLVVIIRDGEEFNREVICPCRFVPLLGKYAFKQ